MPATISPPRLRCLLSLCLALGFPAEAAATRISQAPPYQPDTETGDRLFHERTTFTVKDGVPSSMVRALAVAQDGSLWLGTSGGLARYDGSEFEPFPAASTPGITSDRVLSMYVDRSGVLWAGVEGAPAYRFENGAFEPVGDGNSVFNVEQFFESQDGTIWLAGLHLSSYRNGDLRIYATDSASLHTRSRQMSGSRLGAESIKPTGVHRLAEDAQGVLWLASDHGLLKLVDGELVIEDPQRCTWVLRDFEGVVWARFSDNTVVPMDPAAGTSFFMGAAYIYSELDVGPQRRLLATSEGLELMTVEDNGRLHFENVDGGRRVAALAPSEGDGIWSGTLRDGLQHLRPQYVAPVQLSPEHPELAVANVFSDGALGAIACDIRGKTTAWISSNGEITPLHSPFDDRPGIQLVTGSVCVDGERLVSMSSGLTRQEGDRLVEIPGFGEEVHTVGGGELQGAWMHRRDGLLVELTDSTGATGRSVDIGPFGGRFSPYGDGLLFAAESEVRYFDPATLAVTTMAKLPGITIRHMAEGARGEIWISSYGHGLFRCRPDGTLDQWSLPEGLPNAYLGWVRSPTDDGELLINSNSGVISVSVENLDRQRSGTANDIAARLFPAPEGNGDMGALLGSGLLALPTVRGLVLFDPSATPPRPAAPKVLIQAVSSNGMPWDASVELIGRTVLEFEYRAMAFPSAANAVYEHRLLGQDDDWVSNNDSQHVRYGNVLPGKYTFEVRARTSDRPWSGTIQSPEIVVVAHWYNRTSVRWLAGILAALGIRGLIYLRTRAAEGRTEALRAEVTRRIATEARLRTSEQRFRQLFDTAPSAIAAWDPEGRVLDWNERAGELFGWTIGASQPHAFADQFENPEPAQAAFERVRHGTEDFTILASVRRSAGEPRICRWHFAPIFGGEGEFQMAITLVSDLTDSERASRDIERLRERVAKAEETERSRIARELHDDLSQRLAALAIDAHMASQSVQSNELIGAETLRQFQVQVESIAEDVHALSRKLHPTILDDLGLVRALRSECARRSRHTGIQVNLEIDQRLDEPTKTVGLALFRIAQEAMQNAWKHGEATLVTIRVGASLDQHVLEIADNGVGFAADAAHEETGSGADGSNGISNEASNWPAHDGIGLASMRERARLVGGELEIHSAPGQGTRVLVRAPASFTSNNR